MRKQQGGDRMAKTIEERLAACEQQAEINRHNIEQLSSFIAEIVDKMASAAGQLRIKKPPQLDTEQHIHREDADN